MKFGIGITIAILIIIAGGLFFRKTAEETPVLPNEVAEQNTAIEDLGLKSVVSEPTKKEQSIINKKEQNGMTIEVIQEGTGVEIKNGQNAVVEYEGRLTDGTVFDASARHGKPFSFEVGAGMVIKGWDEGVLGMKVGEKRKLTIPADLAYGASGIPGAIPPNATLVFDVTLLGIE